jgi:glutathione peroxidase
MLSALSEKFPAFCSAARRLMLSGAIIVCMPVLPVSAANPDFQFPSIDGGEIDLADWRGGPVLVVNTASLCGYAGQFDDLQILQDRYEMAGLKVLAVPSNDFDQELADAQAVKAFCAANFDLTLPMTDIQHVKGALAHPFYVWLEQSRGFVPGWNFNKVLLDANGSVVNVWGATTAPLSSVMTEQIEALLP